jgi:hypothetical protein
VGLDGQLEVRVVQPFEVPGYAMPPCRAQRVAAGTSSLESRQLSTPVLLLVGANGGGGVVESVRTERLRLWRCTAEAKNTRPDWDPGYLINPPLAACSRSRRSTYTRMYYVHTPEPP